MSAFRGAWERRLARRERPSERPSRRTLPVRSAERSGGADRPLHSQDGVVPAQSGGHQSNSGPADGGAQARGQPKRGAGLEQPSGAADELQQQGAASPASPQPRQQALPSRRRRRRLAQGCCDANRPFPACPRFRQVYAQLDKCRAYPDFNSYLAFIFASGEGLPIEVRFGWAVATCADLWQQLLWARVEGLHLALPGQAVCLTSRSWVRSTASCCRRRCRRRCSAPARRLAAPLAAAALAMLPTCCC